MCISRLINVTIFNFGCLLICLLHTQFILFISCLSFVFFKVRSKLESLDGIVPPTHGFMISSTAMKNVWLSMEHQAILWCNQLVVQVSEFPPKINNLFLPQAVLNFYKFISGVTYSS